MKARIQFLSIIFLPSALAAPVFPQENPNADGAGHSGWTRQSSGTNIPLYSVSTVSQDVGWASGGTGALTTGSALRTTNGGTTWMNAGTFPGDAYAVCGLDSSTALIGITSLQGLVTVRKTTNGGVTWVKKDSVATSVACLQMVTVMKGYYLAGSTNGTYIRSTTNSGETWSGQPPPVPLSENMMSLFWYDTLHAWFGTNNSHIYRTTDGGLTWQYSSTTFSNAYALYFTTSQLGLVGSDVGSFNRSTDGGIGWTTGLAPVYTPVLSIAGVQGTPTFWAVSGMGAYYTSSAGSTWTISPPEGYFDLQALNAISMITEGSRVFGWVVGGSGVIARYRRISSGVIEGGGESPSVFSLEQNYPNPFNPETRIGIQLTAYGMVTLKVYDVLGREVATLVNEVKQPGRYQITWDARNMPSGVYYYRLAAGQYSETRKCIITK